MAKKSKKTKSPRFPGETQISISLPVNLVGKIDTMADDANRNRSNFITNVLLAKVSKAGK